MGNIHENDSQILKIRQAILVDIHFNIDLIEIYVFYMEIQVYLGLRFIAKRKKKTVRDL